MVVVSPRLTAARIKATQGILDCRSAEAHRANRGELDWPNQAKPAVPDHTANWAIGQLGDQATGQSGDRATSQ